MTYAEKNLGKNEVIVKQADKNALFLLGPWIVGILFCWLLLIPTIKAIIATIRFNKLTLAITNKRVLGSVGVLKTTTLDAPLNKIQNVSERQKFLGKIFNFSTIRIETAAGKFEFDCIKNGNQFKNMIMAQVEQYEEDRIAQQASQLANQMAAALKR